MVGLVCAPPPRNPNPVGVAAAGAVVAAEPARLVDETVGFNEPKLNVELRDGVAVVAVVAGAVAAGCA